MLDKKHKLLELRTSALVDSLFVWNYKTKLKWRWIEFVDYKEYDFSDDVKNIDFLRSEKEWKTLVKIFEEERDLCVYFIIDLNKTFFSEILNVKKIDIVYEFIYLIWLSAIKNGDKVGAFIYDSQNKILNFAKKWKQNFINIVNELEKFQKNISPLLVWDTWNVDRGLKYFNSLKIKNSLVFLITDSLDINYNDLKVLWIKNDLIVCNIFNSFENTLNFKWIVWFNKWDNNIILDLDNKQKVKDYINLRNNKIINFRNSVIKNWWKYILLDETKNTYKEVSKIFRK